MKDFKNVFFWLEKKIQDVWLPWRIAISMADRSYEEFYFGWALSVKTSNNVISF